MVPSKLSFLFCFLSFFVYELQLLIHILVLFCLLGRNDYGLCLSEFCIFGGFALLFFVKQVACFLMEFVELLLLVVVEKVHLLFGQILADLRAGQEKGNVPDSQDS